MGCPPPGTSGGYARSRAQRQGPPPGQDSHALLVCGLACGGAGRVSSLDMYTGKRLFSFFLSSFLFSHPVISPGLGLCLVAVFFRSKLACWCSTSNKTEPDLWEGGREGRGGMFQAHTGPGARCAHLRSCVMFWLLFPCRFYVPFLFCCC